MVPRVCRRSDHAFSSRAWLDSSGERHSGLLAEHDLADWRPRYEPPLAVDYHGLTVLKAGPWSQAPVFLQQLRLLDGFDLIGLGQASAEYVHVLTECAKLAFSDREAWYGDPTSSTCRSTSCSPAGTRTSGASWSATRPRRS